MLEAPPSELDVFTGLFTQQEPLPEEAIAAAIEVMRSGRLHRYNTQAGEVSQAALLESEYAAYQGSKYALACASGGAALQISLRALSLPAGSGVLTNAFTLAPVPGAIAAAGHRPVLVEITPDLTLDLDDLGRKAEASGAKVLMLSHMRGHLTDMDRLMEIADARGLTVIEDCAHTMGATWAGVKSGNHGHAACFSTQTYKHINSGEGGLLTSDDPDFMARAIILSGSYMLYERHGAAPESSHFKCARLNSPNTSSRMDNLRAAVLRPQLRQLDNAIERWNARYSALAEVLGGSDQVRLPVRARDGVFVGSSLQFMRSGIAGAEARAFLDRCAARGVELKWFGADEPAGFTSTHKSWQYMEAQSLPATDAILRGLFDIRLPLTFSPDDCRMIGRIIVESL